MWRKFTGRKDQDRTSKDYGRPHISDRGFDGSNSPRDAALSQGANGQQPNYPFNPDSFMQSSTVASAQVVEYDRSPPPLLRPSATVPVVDRDSDAPMIYNPGYANVAGEYGRATPTGNHNRGVPPPPSELAAQEPAPKMYHRGLPPLPPQNPEAQQLPASQSRYSVLSPPAVDYTRVAPAPTDSTFPNPPASLTSPPVVDYTRVAPAPTGPTFANAPPMLTSPPAVDYTRVAPAPNGPGYDQPQGYGSLVGVAQMAQSPVPPAYSSAPPYSPFRPQPPVPQPENTSTAWRSSGHRQENEWVPPSQTARYELDTGDPPPSRNEHVYLQTPTTANSSSSSLYNQPYSSKSVASTAPTGTSLYSPDRSNQPTPTTNRFPAAAASGGERATSSDDDPNVSKFAARIFCQRKREDGDLHEEWPRDVREFRLVNLALIKLAAGGKRYVLLDAVFGELDRAIAPLLEKHWYITPQTRVSEYSVTGSSRAYKIGPIMVAYKGDPSVLYVEFKTNEECERFRMELQYARNTISG